MIFMNLLNNLGNWGYIPGLFQFSNLLQLLNNQFCQDRRVPFFEKVSKRQIKMVNVHYESWSDLTIL